MLNVNIDGMSGDIVYSRVLGQHREQQYMDTKPRLAQMATLLSSALGRPLR
jgi:hypothetical protein